MSIEYLGAGPTITRALYHLNGNATDSSGNARNGTGTAITYSLANGRLDQGAGFNNSTSQPLAVRLTSHSTSPSTSTGISLGTRTPEVPASGVLELGRFEIARLDQLARRNIPDLKRVTGAVRQSLAVRMKYRREHLIGMPGQDGDAQLRE